MIKPVDDIPVTYLNKGQVYSLSIVGLQPMLPIARPPTLGLLLSALRLSGPLMTIRARHNVEGMPLRSWYYLEHGISYAWVVPSALLLLYLLRIRQALALYLILVGGRTYPVL